MAWELLHGQLDLPIAGGTLILTVIAITGLWISRTGTIALPFCRRHSVNLEAVRPPSPDTPPTVWLVAHLDSKSQLVPMLVRILGVLLCIAAWVTLLVLWAATMAAPVPKPLFVATALCSALGALPLIGTLVGSLGHGALDNASGVATILSATDYLDPTLPIGLLVTSAEELGLAGARAWIHRKGNDKPTNGRSSRTITINCDGIDDHGRLVCMLPKHLARRLRDPLSTAGRAASVTPVIRGILPGVLVDAIAWTQAGFPALTVSRGEWHSLARVHTRDDDLRHMTGAGIDEAAKFIAKLAEVLVDKQLSLGPAPTA
jgi:hypothetical protein